MLGIELLDAGQARGAGKGIERRVALAKRDDVGLVGEDGQQVAKAPDGP